MPRLRATPEQKEIRRFNGWVLANMKVHNVRQKDIADALDLPEGSVSYRLNEKAEWRLTEMIKVCELFGESYEVGR